MHKFSSNLTNSFDNPNNNILSVSNIFFNIFHTVFPHISKLVKYEKMWF